MFFGIKASVLFFAHQHLLNLMLFLLQFGEEVDNRVAAGVREDASHCLTVILLMTQVLVRPSVRETVHHSSLAHPLPLFSVVRLLQN